MYRILLLGLIVIVASSCRKNLDNLSINQAEQRIHGKWTMTEVKNNVRNDGKWSKNDVTTHYRNWEFDFKADRTLTVYIPDEDATLVGSWEIYEDWETDADGETDLNTFLYIYMYDVSNTNNWRELVWENMRVSSDVFKAREESFIEGERVFYFYEMRR
ncbi:MAG: hypothetical protein Crog4KO_05070 [Crocinitomicaceae bacterium]